MAAGLLPWLLWSGVRSRNTEQSPQRAPTRAPVVCTEQGLLSGRPVSASVAWARAMQGPSTSQQRLCWAGGPHLGLAPTPAALAVLGRWPSPGPGPPVAFAVRGRLPSPGPGDAGQAALTRAWPLPLHSRLHLFRSPADSEAGGPPARTPWLCAWRLSNRTLGVDSQRKSLFQRVRKDTCPCVHVCMWSTHSFLSFFSESLLLYTGV